MRKPDNADVGLREDCEEDLADVGHNADLYVKYVSIWSPWSFVVTEVIGDSSMDFILDNFVYISYAVE